MLSFSEVRKLNKTANVIPLFVRIPSDLETPVSAFIKLSKGKTESFLLESIEGGEKLARYSFLGFDPYLKIEGSKDEVVVFKDKERQIIAMPTIIFLKELFAVYKPAKVEGLPRFTGGGVGYFSYDAIRWIERLPSSNDDEIGLPVCRFCFYHNILVFDHLKQELLIIANILNEKNASGLQHKYKKAVEIIGQTVRGLAAPLRLPKGAKQKAKVSLTSLCGKPEFTRMVKKAQSYIKEGDIFQVVLSRRWRITSGESPISVYRRLRRINPSPYMFLLNFGSCSIIGSSPEMMVRIENDLIETRPIAGTRKRGKNQSEDEKNIADLLADPKELAEHTMLLDLGRNDVGRVSVPGSVQVKERMTIEKYSHVIHIVSSVVGKLQKEYSPIDGHFACFPAGTVSGAPKIRAMEIIDELEGQRRGVYAGSIAYLDFWGNLDSCIAIRTIVKNKEAYYVQAGAGIVADSNPSREFLETEAKAQGVIQAIVGDVSK
ncbi:MAG: anthranilate synthase component I [candidate division Zixibacteria bacterium]|nr:anthranilate synthase component I [candidate division Zixibacteria bacterium]